MLSPAPCSNLPQASRETLETVGALQYRPCEIIGLHHHWTETRMLKQFCTTVAIACLFGCGGSGGYSTSPPPSGGVNTPPPTGGISVTNNAFTPATKTVPAGTALTWAWNSCSGDVYSGQTCVSHSVVFDDGVSSSLQDQGTYSRTFTAAGTYRYHCSVHGTAMSGSVTVN
jgi:plastocyanin